MRALVLLALTGCNVYPLQSERAGIAGIDELSHDSCGRGLLVSSSDYQSSNVNAVDRRGNVLTPSLVSSGIAPAGLVQAFSGDVVLPTETQLGSTAILIDRYPQSVLSFVDLRDATITDQVDVSTGFAANPHDAVRLPDGRILVTRFDSNLDPNADEWSRGGDLLVLDAARHEIVGRIDLLPGVPKAHKSMLPHPDRMLLVRSTVYVVVALYSPDYRETGASYLVSIDADTLSVSGSLELTGVAGCSGLALAPSGAELAVVCSGHWRNSEGALADDSGIVGIDITTSATETWSFLATSLTPPLPFGFTVAYPRDDKVVTVALGRFGDGTLTAELDRFVSYDVRTKKAETILHGMNLPFVLGDVRCFGACGRCALADAEGRGRLLLFDEHPDGMTLAAEIGNTSELGLPPRWLGVF